VLAFFGLSAVERCADFAPLVLLFDCVLVLRLTAVFLAFGFTYQRSSSAIHTRLIARLATYAQRYTTHTTSNAHL
jgi:hypothetical protein